MSLLVTGMLLCTAVQLDPLIQSRGEPVSATLAISGDGMVELSGFPDIRNYGAVIARPNANTLSIIGAGTAKMAIVVWGELLSKGDGYTLNWYMPGEFMRDGGYTTAKIGEANCQISKKEITE